MSEKQTHFGTSLPSLGDQIRQWRLARKMTQSELEQNAGLSHNTVSRIECGAVSPRLDTIERIAQALNVSIEQLQFQLSPSKVTENQTGYNENGYIAELIEGLAQIPEPKRGNLLRTFMDLVRIANNDENA